MPETISCPKCDRKLRVPEENFGKLAQCPSCQFTFTAERPSNEPMPPPRSLPMGVARVEEEQVPEPPPRAGWFDEVRKKREARESGQATGDLNFGEDEAGGGRPHRSASVIMLGIIGLVFSCIPILGGTIGLIATAMASSDLQEMARRRMDRSGRGATQAGQWCGAIAIVINILITIFACMGGFKRF